MFMSRQLFPRCARYIKGVAPSFGATAKISASPFLLGQRSFSSTEDLVTMDLEHEAKGLVSLTMNRPPANSLSLEFCQALSEAIKTAESNHNLQVMVLKSSLPSIFSAGLDLNEMHNPDPDRLVAFWTSVQQLFLDLYGSRLACIAALTGHAPAAGCMVALSCDYRIMADNPKLSIGLNESQLGIVAPPWMGQQYIDTIGRRPAERALALGTLFPPQQALELDMVDEVVAPDKVVERATQVALEQWSRIPPPARVASKMLVRKEAIDRMKAARQADVDHFVGFVTNDKTQESLTQYLKMLASKSSKSKS